MKKLLLATVVILVSWFTFIKEDRVQFGPGVFAPEAPLQENIATPSRFAFDNYTITPLAEFRINAKVLSRKSYSSGRESDISPIDFALGWGRMSDEIVLDALDITQSGRWYRWQTQQLPIPRKEIETHSANMHLVPADEGVEMMIERARKGDIVEISGQLIRADAKDGWHWKSSMRRDDVGRGACELIWVEAFHIVSPDVAEL